MISLSAAVLFFLGIHVFVSGTRLRDTLVARLGTRAYLALFSLASLGGIVWMVRAFIAANTPQPTALHELRWLAGLLVLCAFVLVVLGVMTKSPTAVGGDAVLDGPEPVRGVHRITRHPFLWGMALWAATHMLFNPQPPTLVFFGGFLALALLGPFLIDAKCARRLGDRWPRYLALTSNLPFAAIVQGRNRFVPGELGIVKLLVALAVFGGFVMLHAGLFGMPALR